MGPDKRPPLAPSPRDPDGRNTVFGAGASLTPGSALFTCRCPRSVAPSPACPRLPAFPTANGLAGILLRAGLVVVSLGVLLASDLVSVRRVGTRRLNRAYRRAIVWLRADLGDFRDSHLSLLTLATEARGRRRGAGTSRPRCSCPGGGLSWPITRRGRRRRAPAACCSIHRSFAPRTSSAIAYLVAVLLHVEVDSPGRVNQYGLDVGAMRSSG